MTVYSKGNEYIVQHHRHYERAHQDQRPPTPPMDESRFCLPSISNLLDVAGTGSFTTEALSNSRRSTPFSEAQNSSSRHSPNGTNPGEAESRPTSGYAQFSQLQKRMPPTPPMRFETSFEGTSSPTTYSSNQFSNISVPVSNHHEATPPLDGDAGANQKVQPTASRPTLHMPTIPIQALVSQQPLPPLPFPSQNPPSDYYPPPAQFPSQVPILQQQRPLPMSFEPYAVASPPVAPANTWYSLQHHHYMAPSQGSTFAQNPDRYHCPVCKKAFSRPSSLKIHSHSHTGEKPFTCPHPGCGKAFSVRSNMKRHERGCHSFDVQTTGTMFR